MKEKIKKITNNKVLQQIVKTMFLRVLGVVTLFGFTLFLTNTYDPKIIGQYDFIRSYLLILGSICILGADQSIFYFTGMLKSSDQLGGLKEIYLKMVFLILVTCLISLALLFLISQNTINLFLNDDKIYIIILKATLLLFFYCLTILNTEVLRALESIYIAELFRNTFKYLSVIIGSILLFYIHKETFLVETFLIGFFFLSIISTVMIISIFNNKSIYKEVKKEEAISYRFIFFKSYPIAVSTLAIFLLMSFDVMFIKKYKGNEEVAFYSLAVKLMTLLLVVMNSVNITISPKIAELFFSKNLTDLSKTMRQSARMIFIISIPTVLFFCLFATQILTFFGEQYLKAKEPLIILMIGQGICSFFGGVQVYLNMTGRQNIFQVILIFAVVLNFFLNKTLIPIYGMTGGAISYVISMFAWNLIAAIIIYNKDKVKVFLT
ncbi:MAG: MATE family efflux transporter [Flavobacterium sp.]|jgi:O-antigen/teichoic acid export membrane protein|nr:MATE family efflux transporter [Flavobacterium sp.]